MRKNNETSHEKRTDNEPSIAPGIEMDELEEKATSEEQKQGDFTSVTQLYIDRIRDEEVKK